MTKTPKFLKLLFLAFILFGLFLSTHYGNSVDEARNRDRGIVTLNYLADKFEIPFLLNDPILSSFRNLPKLEDFREGNPRGGNAEHGAFFETLSVFLELFLPSRDEYYVYLLRHALNFLFYCVGIYAIFKLAARRFGCWQIGLLASLMMILSPRIFADAFYNSNDLCFLSIFAIGLNYTIQFIIKPSLKDAFLAGLLSAISIDIRITGIVLPLILIAVMPIQFYKLKFNSYGHLKLILIYFITLISSIIVFWPWLWAAPIDNFFYALKLMSKISAFVDVKYFGMIIPSNKLPWHYIPIWILVTTPILYSILWFFGSISILKNFYSSKFAIWKNDDELQDLVFLGICIFPVLGIILLKSVVYDGWRHLYFIYPTFILVALNGGVKLLYFLDERKFNLIRYALIILFALYGFFIALWMTLSHPLQNVFFNSLVGGEWNRKFDVDYWGLSNRNALEYIAVNDARPIIRIWSGAKLTDLPLSIKLLKEKYRKKLVVVDSILVADYIITNYRLSNEDYSVSNDKFIKYKDILVDGKVISSIFKSSVRHDVQQIGVGERVSFNKEGLGVGYLLGAGLNDLESWGWHYPESWGVWAGQPESKLVIPLPYDEIPVQLVIKIRALVGPVHPCQRFQISLNNNLFKNYRVCEPEAVIEIPMNEFIKTSSKILTIGIKSLDTITPKILGLGEDIRPLSVGLIELGYRM